MSLKDKINSENPLIDFKGLNEYHSRMSALQQANTNKIAQIVGELAGATAQLTKTTAKVDCDHRYEITGATGDEHNLAIEDQQMLINKISGRTLVKNQLIDSSEYQDASVGGMTITKNADGSLTLNGIASEPLYYSLGTKSFTLKGLLYAPPSAFPPNSESEFVYYVNTPYTALSRNVNFNNFDIENQSIYIYIHKETTYNNVTIYPQIINLTQAYNVGNEPRTNEDVLNDFPEYIPYNEGEFVHSNNKLVSTGRNLWDEEWEQGWIDGNGNNADSNANFRSKNYISVSPNTEYYVKTDSTSIAFRFYDNNKKLVSISGVIANQKITTPENSYFMRFFSSPDGQSTYNNDICINVYDESFNGTYEPYKEEVVEVGELKQWDYKDNQSGNDVFGTGELDLGTLDWTLDESEGVNYFSALSPEDSKTSTTIGVPCICSKYSAKQVYYSKMNDKELVMNTSYSSAKKIVIRDDGYTDAESLKASLSGVMLAYELETPTIIENDNLPAGYAVYKGGMQIQEGTIPYVIEKQYALSIASQVLQNIEIDREQQEQINNMKVDINQKQPLLLSGQNIKTFNGQSMLGSGDLAWNDPMFLAKFNRVTLVDNIIDEFLEGKQYRIYSNSDTGLNFDIQVRINLTDLATGGAFDYVNLNLYSSKNYVDFQYMGYSLSSNSKTIYINYILNGVETTKTYTYNGSDYVIADVINNGSISIVGTYAAVFEPVEVATKEDLVEIKPIQSIKEVLVIGERGEIYLSKMPILIKPIYMYNKTKGNSYYLFYDLSSGSTKCMKNGLLKQISEIFYSLSLYPQNDTKAIEFEQSEYEDGDIIEIIYEYGYIDPTIFIEA